MSSGRATRLWPTAAGVQARDPNPPHARSRWGLLRNQFSTLDPFKDYGLTIEDDLTLINTGLNKYDGLATVHTRKGTQKYLTVTVWADPTGAMFYQMDPTSAANLIEAARKEAKQD